MRWLLPCCLLLMGCPICPDGELRLVKGQLPLGAGESAAFELVYDGEVLFGPDRCGGFWDVGVTGGDGTPGTPGVIDECGHYTAPAAIPADGLRVRIEAGEFELGTCADCCPGAARTLALRPSE